MFWGAFLPYSSHRSGLAPCSGFWNFPRFYRLFLQVLDRSKVANTSGCSKTGLIYCGEAVMNRMMPGGSWTVICFSCHCGAQRHRQCSCPCHDLMHYYHSFEPIWWYNLQEREKMSACVVCSTHLFAVNQGWSGLSVLCCSPNWESFGTKHGKKNKSSSLKKTCDW